MGQCSSPLHGLVFAGDASDLQGRGLGPAHWHQQWLNLGSIEDKQQPVRDKSDVRALQGAAREIH